MKEEDWIQWANNPVTQTVRAYLQELRDNNVENILNLDVASKDFNLEQYALNSLALRYMVDGQTQFLDFETLKADLVEDEHVPETE